MKIRLAAFILCATPLVAFAQNHRVEVPREAEPFVEAGMIPIAIESGDLNGDGIKDYVLVLSKPTKEDVYDETGDADRPTLILVGGANGKLSLAGRNDKAAYCKNCGGVMGDPFQGVRIDGTSFTVSNYGGSNWRWAYDYKFAYSRRDKQWQLVRAEETTFNALSPDDQKIRVYTPPKSFGLIPFDKFDPGSYLRKGAK